MKLEQWKAWVEDLTFVRQILRERWAALVVLEHQARQEMNKAVEARDTAAAKAHSETMLKRFRESEASKDAGYRAGRLLEAAKREVARHEETKRLGEGPRTPEV